LLGRRPDLAEHVAKVLAERQTELITAKERVNSSERAQLKAQQERALISRIRNFFQLD
jgi:hypothetical protein